MNIFVEPNASLFFLSEKDFFLFTKCKSGPILQFIYSYGLWMCRRTFQPEFFHFPCKYFHPGLKEDRRFSGFYLCKKKKISFIRNWILYLLHCIFFPGSLPSCFHALIFQSFCCNLFCFSSKNFRIYYYYITFSSVQSLSSVRLFATLWTAAHQASLCITNSQSLRKLMSIQLVMPSNNPTILLLLYSI